MAYSAGSLLSREPRMHSIFSQKHLYRKFEGTFGADDLPERPCAVHGRARDSMARGLPPDRWLIAPVALKTTSSSKSTIPIMG